MLYKIYTQDHKKNIKKGEQSFPVKTPKFYIDHPVVVMGEGGGGVAQTETDVLTNESNK